MADVNDDIVKYLKGELTPAEMHSLEKKALDDPFIAEALEGAMELSPADLDDDLRKLQSAIEKRMQPSGKEIPFWVWPARVAAGLLVIVIASYIIVSLSTDKAPETLAVNKEASPSVEKAAPATPATEDSSVEETPESKAEIRQDADREQTENQQRLPTENPKASPPTAAPQLQDEDIAPSTSTLQPAKEGAANPSAGEKSAKAEQEIAVLPGAENNADDAFKKKDIAASRTRSREADKSVAGAPAEALSRDEAIRSKVIKGKVKSEDGSALPGVNVLIKGTNVGTVTDLSGNYQLAVTNPGAILAFNFIGFKETEIKVGQKEEINVELPVDATELSEVVVTGYSIGRGSDEGTTATLELASPVDGQKAFKRYLENNLHYPEQAVASRVEGKVTIQFTVESSGQLSDFTIIQGIGQGCDEEAIRLVREGPAWVPTRRNGTSLRDKVKVRIKFTLPKNK